MELDLKAKATELIEKIKNDEKLQSDFTKEPVKTVEKLLGIDLPDEQINQIVAGIKAKIGMDNLAGALGGLFGKK